MQPERTSQCDCGSFIPSLLDAEALFALRGHCVLRRGKGCCSPTGTYLCLAFSISSLALGSTFKSLPERQDR